MKSLHRNTFRRFTAAVVAAAASIALIVAPASAAATVDSAEPGTLVSAEEIGQFSAEQITTMLRNNGADTGAVRDSVTAYRLTYRTTGLDHRPTTASGLVVLPTAHTGTLHAVVHTHGTLAKKAYAPSAEPRSLAGLAALYYGSAGALAIAPDYLGLGSGPGMHPYMHLPTEVGASADMLRATKQFTDRRGLSVDPNLLVTGFSQGGRVAMGLGERLQRDTVAFWRLRALAPVSGVHFAGEVELPAILDGSLDNRLTSYNLAYYLIALNRRLHLYDSPEQAFQQPYAGWIEQQFDGTRDAEEIAERLPEHVRELITPEMLTRLRRPTGELRHELTVGDHACKWPARVPVLLLAASGDRNVAPANSQRCQAEIQKRHGDATLVDLGDADHFASAFLALPRILQWWQQLG